MKVEAERFIFRFDFLVVKGKMMHNA